jgi:hypothetical protein
VAHLICHCAYFCAYDCRSKREALGLQRQLRAAWEVIEQLRTALDMLHQKSFGALTQLQSSPTASQSLIPTKLDQNMLLPSKSSVSLQPAVSTMRPASLIFDAQWSWDHVLALPSNSASIPGTGASGAERVIDDENAAFAGGEMERVLRRHPAVIEAVVVAVILRTGWGYLCFIDVIVAFQLHWLFILYLFAFAPFCR